MTSSHIANPELIIFGWQSDDDFIVMGADKFCSVNVEAHYSAPEEWVTKSASGSIVSTSYGVSEARYTITAETGFTTDPALWMVSDKGSYGAAIRILGSTMLSAVADTATHASIAEAVADELGVWVDDDLVQRIAAAVIASGAFSAT